MIFVKNREKTENFSFFSFFQIFYVCIFGAGIINYIVYVKKNNGEF